MKLLAVDFDGTIADDDGNLTSEAEQMLPMWRETQELQIVVCTGRRLTTVEPEVREFADAIVAENGGVIDWGDKIEIGATVTETVEEMVEHYFPPHQYEIRRTMVFIECHPDNFPNEFMNQVGATGYELVRNNETAALSPPEFTKSNGLRHATAYRQGNHDIIAVGDSANDLDLLKMADHALTPANGDEILSEKSCGEPFYRGDQAYFPGVKDEIHRLVTGDK